MGVSYRNTFQFIIAQVTLGESKAGAVSVGIVHTFNLVSSNVCE